jgi:hypothetical protein
MGVIPMQESTVGGEILVIGGSPGKEKSTRCDRAPNACHHLLHAFPKRTVLGTTSKLV